MFEYVFTVAVLPCYMEYYRKYALTCVASPLGISPCFLTKKLVFIESSRLPSDISAWLKPITSMRPPGEFQVSHNA